MTLLQRIYHNLSAVLFLGANVSVFIIMAAKPKKALKIMGIGATLLLLVLLVYIHLIVGNSGIFEKFPVALMFVPLYFLSLYELGFVHALFIISAELAVAQLISFLTAFFAQRIWEYESDKYCIAMIMLLAIVLIVYVTFIQAFGKRIITGLFTYTTNRIWLLYSVFCLTIVFLVKYFYFSPASFTPVELETDAYSMALPAYMIASFILMSGSILSTHARLAAEYDLSVAQHIINSGREYYESLTEMTEHLQKLKHDNKFHLTAVQKLIEDGQSEEARRYLNVLTERGEEKKVSTYTDSRVLNALLYGYAERSAKEGAEFFAQIDIDEKMKDEMDEYELCVIVGNLLENAMEAVKRTPTDQKKYIDIVIRRHEMQYGIMVENSFDGYVVNAHDGLASIKSPSKTHPTGIGISSIKAIAARHSGDYCPSWDDKKFSAYVVMKVGN